MFNESAYLYDAIYRSLKNYKDEAEKIKGLIQTLNSKAKTLLDVACGSGEHDLYLKDVFQVDGIDIEKEFVRIAQEKNPAGSYRVEDMTAFDLGRKYDVVACLFSSIGYVRTRENLHKTIQNMANHLKSDGIMLVEPWFSPEQWQVGRTSMQTVDQGDLKICRMSKAGVKDRLSFFYLHFLVANFDSIRHFSELHELGLFTPEEMLAAFHAADLRVKYDEIGIFNRGLYIAQR